MTMAMFSGDELRILGGEEDEILDDDFDEDEDDFDDDDEDEESEEAEEPKRVRGFDEDDFPHALDCPLDSTCTCGDDE